VEKGGGGKNFASRQKPRKKMIWAESEGWGGGGGWGKRHLSISSPERRGKKGGKTFVGKHKERQFFREGGRGGVQTKARVQEGGEGDSIKEKSKKRENRGKKKERYQHGT